VRTSRRGRRKDSGGSPWALLLLLSGVVAAVAAVLHPAVSLISTARFTPEALSGGSSLPTGLVSGPVAAESGGLVVIAFVATVLGLAVAVARLS
jgi:hypothetical protein